MAPKIVIDVPASADSRTIATAEMLVASSKRIGAVFGVASDRIAITSNARVTKSMVKTMRALFSQAIDTREWDGYDDAVFGYGK